jgi:hypothetical protein
MRDLVWRRTLPILWYFCFYTQGPGAPSLACGTLSSVGGDACCVVGSMFIPEEEMHHLVRLSFYGYPGLPVDAADHFVEHDLMKDSA